MIITGYIGPIHYQDVRWEALGLPRPPRARREDPAGWRVRRLTEREMLRFVLDVVDGHIFLAEHVRPARDPETMIAVFPAADFVRDISRDAGREIGTFYEYIDRAIGKTRNGQPSFSSIQFLHREDWARALDMIAAEALRRERTS